MKSRSNLMVYILCTLLGFLSLTSVTATPTNTEGHSETLQFTDTNCQITVSTAFKSLPFAGHSSFKVTVRNNTNSPVLAELHSTARSSARIRYNRENDLSLGASFNFPCPAKEEVTYDVLIPIGRAQSSDNYWGGSKESLHENDLNLEIKIGSETEFLYFDNNFTNTTDNIAFSSDVVSQCSTEYTSSRSLQHQNISLELKSLTGYDYLVFSEKNWSELTKAQKNTIKSWVHQGGNLIFATSNTEQFTTDVLPQHFPNIKQIKKHNIHSAIYHSGTLEVHDIANLKTHYAKITDQTNRGTSRLALKTLHSGPSSYDQIKADFAGMDHSRAWKIREDFGTQNFGTFSLCIIIICFAILVGPINFFVFARQGKRHKLFITTPIIAFSASIVLIAYIILSEGFGGSGLQLVHKEINHKDKVAYISQEQFSRTGVLLGSGFELNNDLEIIQVPIAKSRWARVMDNQSGSDENYRHTTGETTTKHQGNYFSARSEHGHLIRGSEITQESIQVTFDGTSYSVTSTLSAPIDTLYFHTEDGYYQVNSLNTGTDKKAEPIDSAVYNNWVSETSQLFTESIASTVAKLGNRKNSFVAISSEAEGVATLASIDWDCNTVITGTFNPNRSN